MKRILLVILTITLSLSVFSGCNKSNVSYAYFSSYMLNSQDRDDPDDDRIREMLLPSKALFAYKIEQSESNTIQTVYVWHNQLRRELWSDIIQLYYAVPDKDKDITIAIDDEIRINNKKIEFEASSELSFTVLRAIIPTEIKVNAKTFRRIFREMFIRLETIESLGDYEVIVIQTIAEEGFILENKEGSTTGKITEVMDLEEFTE